MVGESVPLAVAAIVVVLGAISQRIIGMGFAMVASPIFALVFGPAEGILLVNIGGFLAAAFVLARLWRDVNWRRYMLMGPAALVAAIPTSYLVVRANADAMQIAVAVILLIGLSIPARDGSGKEISPRWWVISLAGASSGVTSAAAGVGAPPMGIYRTHTNWPVRAFSATVQPVFMTAGLTAIITKITTSDLSVQLDTQLWIWFCGLIILGLALGEFLQPLVIPAVAKRAVVALCYVASVFALFDGILGLFPA